jgi:hypothetical protein
MNFNDIEQIKETGFTGFKTFEELFVDNSIIPFVRGVYLVINTKKTVDFLPVGTGGYFKNKDPNVSVDMLVSNWIDNTLVVYIGKAGGEGSNATLRSRLIQYIRFGRGKNVSHYGGRYIWQLNDAANLVVSWKALPNDNPRDYKNKLLTEFMQQHKRLPFANLQN